MGFIGELKWRGMIKDIIPGTEEQLSKEKTTGYVGFDPTSDSLHIGNLVTIMLLVHLQRAGHKPIALVGGATGMVGDPSGKSEERNLLDTEMIRHNQESIKRQLSKFLDFGAAENPAEIVNNYDWLKDMTFLDFIREVGKHITINYMLAKDSVQRRLETGLSFTEFSYQLVQGYDFYYLYEKKNCKLQMGGSDQWGNIVTGNELIRRKAGKEAFALTCPLITKADGSKFGKSEEGNIWLDATKTSPYKFYQFWVNTSDEDAESYIKIFTLLSREEIEAIIREHQEQPHLRKLQKKLAEDITCRVHGMEAVESAVHSSEILFANSSNVALTRLTENEIIDALDGEPSFYLPYEEIEGGIPVVDLLSEKTTIFSSKGEARRMIKDGGLSINKKKVLDMNSTIVNEDLIHDKFLIVQRGKKNYYLIVARR